MMTYRSIGSVLGIITVLLVAGPACVVNVASNSVQQATVQPVATPTAAADPTAEVAPTQVAAQSATPTPEPDTGPTFILLRAPDVTSDARLNFLGHGFGPSEQAAVSIADAHGGVEAQLDSVDSKDDGRIDEVSAAVPSGLTPGDHNLVVTGQRSGRTAKAVFHLRWLAPKVQLDQYSAKGSHTFGFSGSGFSPAEQVDVRLGGLGGQPLASFQADATGNVVGSDITLPLAQAGDYPLYFVGHQSQTPVSVAFNIQGFKPWVVLDNYSPPPYYHMGFKGQDFIPGEPVQVFVKNRGDEPVFQLLADANGTFDVQNAFELPVLPKGDNRLIFVGQQSGVEIATNFVQLAFGPSLELSVYAGRPGTPIAFAGSGWARGETVNAYVGQGRQQVATFQADATGAFDSAGLFRLPIGAGPGGVPLTVVGQTSQAEATLWFQALDLQPSAELSAYEGPPGTVVSFTGRGFAGGEVVHVHLKDKDGQDLASATADDSGTLENVSSYPVSGDWGDDIPFVLVGAQSGAKATTDFKIVPTS
ncbi:MAG: hypothetical protein JOZ81_26040 [Chloroflexi bacterium]|nr:hypothetical protein [Chloroflexota bacterium]